MKRILIMAGTLAALAAFAAGQAPGRGGWRDTPRINTPTQPEPLPWDLRAAAHLMRRAGFSAPPERMRDIVDQGFESILEELLNPDSVDDSQMEAELAARGYTLAVPRQNNDALRPNGQNLQRVWLYRMLNSRRQLQEKMTLFWHDHFATSVLGVNFVNASGTPLVQIQNDTLRAHALGNFKELVRDVARDPAMIIWLDNFSNVAGSPNENWARELMELFTMGEGSGYTEFDIQEAARAFTGWTLSRRTGQFAFNPRAHDYGDKTVLGQTISSPPGLQGISDGDRVIDIIFERPAVAEYLVRKLWEFFVYPNPSDQIVDSLAETFRASGYEIRPLMRAIFTHPHFMSVKAYRAKIKSPVEFTVQAFRELGVHDPDNIPRLTAFFGLGQNLYYPPDVGGWTSDVGWINTGTVLARFNLMTCVVANRVGEPWICGTADNRQERFNPVDDQIDVDSIIAENELFLAAEVVGHFLRAMVQDDVTLDSRYALEDYLASDANGALVGFDISDPVAVDQKVRGLIYLISTLPAYQLN